MESKTMKTLVTSLVLLVGTLTETALPQAQQRRSPPPVGHPSSSLAYSPAGHTVAVLPGYSFTGSPVILHREPYYYHSATLAEAQLRGMASVIQAEAIWIEKCAAATKELQLSRQIALANRKAEIEHRRQLTKQYKKEQAEEYASRRRSHAAASQMHAHTPKQNQRPVLDELTGTVAWPEVLLRAEYADERTFVDECFARAANGAPDANDQAKVNHPRL